MFDLEFLERGLRPPGVKEMLQTLSFRAINQPEAAEAHNYICTLENKCIELLTKVRHLEEINRPHHLDVSNTLAVVPMPSEPPAPVFINPPA